MRRPVLATVALLACAPKPALDLGPAPDGVTVDARVQYYDITGASLNELRQAMRQMGPRWDGRTWPAVTTSDFKWTFKVLRTGVGCGVERGHVQMHTVVVFPRWTPSAEPDSALVEWWRQLDRGLVEHEKGHALIAMRTAGEIVRDLDRVTTTCEVVSRAANDVAQRLVQESRKAQIAYDSSTRHGDTQIRQAGRLKEP